ncbi:MAG TPA: hypothetical protein VFV78_10490 [Vicinamibacterales bacterium]|nr:hypothetical protein [Vicinamibacterales bacterium]
MSIWRVWLAALALSLVVTASVMAFLILSVPGMRDRPLSGLVVAATLFVLSLAGAAALIRKMRRRK